MNWDLTIDQKDKFLELMNSMGAHSTYYMSSMVKKLNSCGIPASEDLLNNCMIVGDKKISLTKEAIDNKIPDIFLRTSEFICDP
jgi:hypothetical protein